LCGLSISHIIIAKYQYGQGLRVSNFYNFLCLIAITAASGNLGKAIVKQLLQELSNEQVIAIARNPEKVNFPGVEARRGDYNNRKQFDEALMDTDAVGTRTWPR
jgi:hypothetical protein